MLRICPIFSVTIFSHAFWKKSEFLYRGTFIKDVRQFWAILDLPTYPCPMYSGVHVLLVSLFGIPIVWSISHFFGRPNIFCGIPNFFFGRPNFFLVYQIFCLVYQIFFGWLNLFFGRPKKWEIDWRIGIPKRLTKNTRTPLKCCICWLLHPLDLVQFAFCTAKSDFYHL